MIKLLNSLFGILAIVCLGVAVFDTIHRWNFTGADFLTLSVFAAFMTGLTKRNG